MGRGAGPSKLMPSGSYPEPWQGHLNLFSLDFQSGVHPRWVQIAEITKMPSVLRTTQMRYANWNLVSTQIHDGLPIRLRNRRRHEIPESVPHLTVTPPRAHVRDFGAWHPPG